jgi:hypothetical protein
VLKVPLSVLFFVPQTDQVRVLSAIKGRSNGVPAAFQQDGAGGRSDAPNAAGNKSPYRYSFRVCGVARNAVARNAWGDHRLGSKDRCGAVSGSTGCKEKERRSTRAADSKSRVRATNEQEARSSGRSVRGALRRTMTQGRAGAGDERESRNDHQRANRRREQRTGAAGRDWMATSYGHTGQTALDTNRARCALTHE